ncbi:hypothetical protein NX059_007780 [Plenodomus lindquistii]|nr:hypothetical protein NX059_007780 [Plenodomus lindquistii]
MDQVDPLLPNQSSELHLRASQYLAPSTTVAVGMQDGHAGPSIDQVIREFLENTKARFGESSIQVDRINKALHDFWSVKISKKDAITRILLELRDQLDLRQNLINILYHRDARWGVGDFDFGQTPLQPIPQFLQPVHQPHLRIPPMNSSWITDHRPFHTINPAILGGGYRGPQIGQEYRHDSLHPQLGDRMWPLQSQPPSSPISQGSFYSPFSNNLKIPAPDFSNSTTHHSRPFADSVDDRSHGSPTFTLTPVVMFPAQTTVDMPPPSKKRQREASSIDSCVNEHQPGRIVCSVETSGSPERTEGPPRKKVDAKTPKAPPEVSGRFVHSLCGKAFSTRYKVKKHHWGTKTDDIDTTTGCWAKHQKPNVAWDAHPSCKEQPAASITTKRTMSRAAKKASEHSLLPAQFSHGVIPGFPTLGDLPQAVAKVVSPSVATHSTPEDAGTDLDGSQQSDKVNLRVLESWCGDETLGSEQV